MTATVIVVAAGRGERLGSTLPKAFVELAGKPLLGHVLDRLERSGMVSDVVVVAPFADLGRCRAICDRSGLPSRVVAGGARRQDSVRIGLDHVQDSALVAVHDAARPLVSPELVRRTIEEAARSGAAMAAIAATDSVKEVDELGAVVGSLPRERIWLAQTPQVFQLELLREAHRKAFHEGREATDDAALVASLGIAVQVVVGEASNLKITVPEDLRLAEAWLAAAPAV